VAAGKWAGIVVEVLDPYEPADRPAERIVATAQSTDETAEDAGTLDSALVVAETALVRREELSAADAGRVRAYREEARAKNTRKAYTYAWRGFARWLSGGSYAVDFPREAIPYPVIAAYLTALADLGRTVSTIEQALAAIASVHRAAGLPFDWKHPTVAEPLAGIRRRLKVAQKQKAPLQLEDLLQLLGALDLSSLEGLRDRALITCMFWSARRGATIAALDIEHLTFEPDGLLLQLVDSKENQEGAALFVKLPPFDEEPLLCPVGAMRDYLATMEQAAGPVFPHPRLPRRLDVDELRTLVQRVTIAAGLDEEHAEQAGRRFKYGSHSFRTGFVLSAVERGEGNEAIRAQTGHKTDKMIDHYARNKRLLDRNAVTRMKLRK
jgi:integrase